MVAALKYDPQRLADFCRSWRIVELSLFGSAVRGELRDHSDVDVLVRFDHDASWSLLDLVAMQEQLSEIFNRPVDLVTRRAIERSRNWIRRRAILESAEPVYAAG